MVPERKGLEFGVGLFIILGLFCLGYLSFTLGNIDFGSHNYVVKAVFPTVAGLKNKAQVMLAGVSIGEVKNIRLKDDRAEVVMSIKKSVKLEEDSIASIKTMGIIGEKYVSISPGASDTYLKNGGIIRETQPPLDIESLIARFVFGSIKGKKTEK
jgi:phospholipid/cholesterol/gamma-HCH transport system substrate-binding protein